MLNIGSKIFRNLPEQVSENMKQIKKLWEKLDGLDVYDNVLVLESLDSLTPEQLEILARPVSFIVYNNEVYMKKGVSGSNIYFDKVFSVSESSGTITFASGEITVVYPLGTVSLSSSSVDSYTKTKIDALLNDKLDKTGVLNAVYPVGAIYMSTVSTSPASLFGGTWQALEAKFLLGAGSGYNAGDTGGEATHTLDINEMPNHKHQPQAAGQVVSLVGGGSNIRFPYTTDGDFKQLDTVAVGGGQAHNNMPPYLVVYMWKRTA